MSSTPLLSQGIPDSIKVKILDDLSELDRWRSSAKADSSSISDLKHALSDARRSLDACKNVIAENHRVSADDGQLLAIAEDKIKEAETRISKLEKKLFWRAVLNWTLAGLSAILAVIAVSK